MGEVQDSMQHLRHERDAILAQEGQQEIKSKEEKTQTRKAVADLLKRICADFVHGDEQLQVIDEGQQLSPGYVVMDTAVPSYRALSFAVSGECQANHVEILVSDQKWRQVNNFVGNWGNWTDQETVYSGDLDETAIRKKVETAFLDWYQEVLARRAAVRNDSQ
jgi:hypothetical protein